MPDDARLEITDGIPLVESLCNVDPLNSQVKYCHRDRSKEGPEST